MDFVNNPNIEIDKYICIRSHFAKSTCSSCADVCIVDAVTFTPYIKINRSLCINCGLCYAACQFSAVYTKKDNRNLLKLTDEKKDIDIGCIFSNAEIKVACISRITEDLLISWFHKKKDITVKKGDCSKCKFKKTLNIFYSNLKLSILLAKATDIKLKIKIRTNKSDRPYVPKEQISRRELFSSIKIGSKNATSKRKIVLRAVDSKIKNNTAYPYAAELKISDNCTVCGLCEHICSLDAILIKQNNESASIYFNPSLCIACKSCESACIYDALKIKPSTIEQIVQKPCKVFESKKKVCQNCSKEFYSNSEKELCRECELKNSRKSSLIDFFNNI